ncbi:hypothetical protein EYF80_062707 [Liparis tanakae]|uniref:Uncharacterized protein n=1 Tax=Liparis tanakae TaxID=230148 RepID=A0A4Z2EF19_9TELE|nr:hypothetical protein EYF80_062707 [Liparis tanakae]
MSGEARTLEDEQRRRREDEGSRCSTAIGTTDHDIRVQVAQRAWVRPSGSELPSPQRPPPLSATRRRSMQ